MKRAFLLLLACAGVLESQSLGQAIFRIHDGAEVSYGLSPCARCADLDGDGVDDYLLAAPYANSVLGIVFAISGSTGIELWRIQGNVTNAALGKALADAGDFDGDGVPDIVAGAPDGGPGFADVYSGATRARLVRSVGDWTDGSYLYGRSLARLGDVDLDGFDDVAIGGDSTYARILGGPDGHLIRQHNGPSYGAAVAGLGDVDGDIVPDYIIGWQQSSVNGAWTGTVRAYSGATGGVLYAVHGDNPGKGSFDGDHLGHSVAAIGDLDGDGIQDFVAGAPGGSDILHVSGPGFVRGYSGASGEVLFTHHGAAYNSTLGVAVSSGNDINGDGLPDLLAGGPNETVTIKGQGAVYCFSGGTGATLWKILGLDLAAGLGEYIAVLDDLDGDGYAEFAVGDRQGAQGAGRVTIYRGGPGDAVRFCAAAPNSSGQPARIDIDGPISISFASMGLLASQAPPNQFGLFFYGGSEVGNPFGNGTICAGVPIFRLGPPQQLDASGSTSRVIDFSVPPVGSGPGQWTPGSTWILQFWYRDPMAGGAFFNLSDALATTFTP